MEYNQNTDRCDRFTKCAFFKNVELWFTITQVDYMLTRNIIHISYWPTDFHGKQSNMK